MAVLALQRVQTYLECKHSRVLLCRASPSKLFSLLWTSSTLDASLFARTMFRFMFPPTNKNIGDIPQDISETFHRIF